MVYHWWWLKWELEDGGMLQQRDKERRVKSNRTRVDNIQRWWNGARLCYRNKVSRVNAG